jgi:hypothetical protein
VTLQVPLTIIAGGSNSPWSVPLDWSSIAFLGLTYGPANPDGVGGKVTVRRAKRQYKWHKKDPPGADGYVSTYHGIKPIEFEMVFWFWTGAQYDRLTRQVIPLLLINGVKAKTNPVTVYHPALAALNIGQVTTEFVGQPEATSEDKPDLWRWPVQVSEYLTPPKLNTTATPQTPLSDVTAWAPGASVGRQPNPVVVAQQREIQALKDKLKGAQSGPPTPF